MSNELNIVTVFPCMELNIGSTFRFLGEGPHYTSYEIYLFSLIKD